MKGKTQKNKNKISWTKCFWVTTGGKILDAISRFSTRQQDRVLMHCRDGVVIKTISSIAEANFSDEIHDRLKKMQ